MTQSMSYRRKAALLLFPAVLAAATAKAGAPTTEYTLLFHESAADSARRGDATAGPAYWNAWGAYAKAMTDAGIVRGGSAVTPGAGRTLRFAKGKPAAATSAKEQPALGGYFVIEVADEAAALDWARKAPVGDGRVDVEANLKRDMK